MNIVAVARGFVQFVLLLAELSPQMVKLWREYQARNGRLKAPDRKRLTETVKAAVKTKDTTELEAMLKGTKGPE